MWSMIWHGVFFDPIYNGLVFFIDAIPGGDVGIAIILITVVVKFLLFPLSLKAARTQKVMKELDPKLKAIKEKHKDDRESQAKAMMEAYQEAGLNPFASIVLLFVQIPIVIALYWAVSRGGGIPLPDINVDLLYSFIPTPETINVMFLGLIDITQKSLPLAALAGITQFIHAQLSIPKPEARKDGEKPDMKADLARSMQMQMRYMMPVLIFVVAYTISAAIAIYFTVSNLMALLQELIVRKHR